MSEAFRIVIPARYASVRLPGKPLREICGKPMIEWVYRAASASSASEVIVATDDQRIVDVVEGLAGRACMTDSSHRSGSDRILEVARQLNWSADSIVVNLQGDEPLMPAENMSQVAALLAQDNCSMATLHKPIDASAAQDPNVVKLVPDREGRALYFSRSPIPYQRNPGEAPFYGHIGIYAYRVGFLEIFSQLEPCELELAEALEQLRALCYGYRIATALARSMPGPGVDTEEDLVRVETILQAATK